MKKGDLLEGAVGRGGRLGDIVEVGAGWKAQDNLIICFSALMLRKISNIEVEHA